MYIFQIGLNLSGIRSLTWRIKDSFGNFVIDTTISICGRCVPPHSQTYRRALHTPLPIIVSLEIGRCRRQVEDKSARPDRSSHENIARFDNLHCSFAQMRFGPPRYKCRVYYFPSCDIGMTQMIYLITTASSLPTLSVMIYNTGGKIANHQRHLRQNE